MRTIGIYLIFVTSSTLLFSQKGDFQWVIGYNGDPFQAGAENTVIDFNNNQVRYLRENKNINMFETNASICTSTGNILFFGNGCFLNDKNGNFIPNGDTTMDLLYKEFCVNLGGYSRPDGATILPFPNHPNQYYFFQTGDSIIYQPTISGSPKKLSYTIVDFSDSANSPEILIKNKLLIRDSLGGAQLEAVQHANGRDWWIVQLRWKTNKYYFFLLDPTGVKLHHIQNIGNPLSFRSGYSQAAFSPDGKKFANYNPVDDIFLFDFDRGTGMLSDEKYISMNDSAWLIASGLSFSPNSQFLYASNASTVQQFDTKESDVAKSRELVAEYDVNAGFSLINLGRQALTPDGRIFMDGMNGVEAFHIIENPDKKGVECNVHQHAVVLPYPYFYDGFPNMPNFRLGPIDGSPADTLGIDNHPWAHWRWTGDTISPMQVFFKDLSAYEPTTWHWDFGDGQSSADTSPTHVYASAGTYNVCEIVSNAFASDTFCRLVTVSTVSIPTVFEADELTTAPNPVTDEWRLFFKHPLERETLLRFFDVSGRLVFSEKIKIGTVVGQVSLGGLPNGLFVWNLSQNGVFLQNGRVVKVE
jgi:PKD domain